MSLPTVVAAPAAKPAAVAAPVVEITPTITTPVVETTTTTTAIPTKSTRGSGVDSINARFAELEEATKSGVTVEQLRAKKSEAEAAKKITEPVQQTTTTTTTEDQDSDAAIQKEIDAKFKNQPGEVKESFRRSRQAERELKRQLKGALPSEKATEFETQITELKQQLDAAKKSPIADPAEVQTLKDQLTALQARDTERETELMVAKVERTDAWKNAVTTPKADVQAFVDKLATKHKVSAETLMAALTDTSDNQSDLIEAAMEPLNTLEKTRFLEALSKITKANESATTLRAQAKDALAKIDAKTATQSEAQIAQAKATRDAAHIKSWDALKAGDLKEVLTPLEGDDDVTKAWNKAQSDMEAYARGFDFSTLAPEDQAVASQRMAAYPLIVGAMNTLRQELATSRTENESLLARVTKLEGNKPSGDNITETTTTTDAAKGAKGFVERVGAQIEAAKAAGRIR